MATKSNPNFLLQVIAQQRDEAFYRAAKLERERDAARRKLATQQAAAVPTTDAPTPKQRRKERLYRWQRPARAAHIQTTEWFKIARGMVTGMWRRLGFEAGAPDADTPLPDDLVDFADRLMAESETLFNFSKGERFNDMVDRWSDRCIRDLLPRIASAGRAQAEEQAEPERAAAWFAHSRMMAQELRRELSSGAGRAPIFHEIREQQRDLFKSIPSSLSAHLAKLADDSLVSGASVKTIISKLVETARLTPAHARRVAQSATAQASTALTLSGARAAGCETYTWRTVGDGDVRDDPTWGHKRLNGQRFRVDGSDAPICGKHGFRGPPGSAAGCRCYAEPDL